MPKPNVAPKLHESKRVSSNEKMTGKELRDYINLNGFSIKEFSDLMGVTPQAMQMWLNGSRAINITNTRIIRLFMKHPTMIKEF